MDHSNMTTGHDKYRFQALAALFATSRGAEFLSAFDTPAKGHEPEVQDALAGLFESRLPDDIEHAVLRSDVEAALRMTAVGDAAEAVVDWIDDLPDSGGASGHANVYYWRGVFMSPGLAEDRDGPPEVATDKWRSLRAAGEERPQDAPDPDPLADAAERYRRDSAQLRALRDRIEDWQKGPFSDFDLKLGQKFDWPIGEGLMWTAWTEAIDYWLTKLLWAAYEGSFTQAEKDAVYQWAVRNTEIARAEALEGEYASQYQGLDIALFFPGPPGRPDEMLRGND